MNDIKYSLAFMTYKSSSYIKQQLDRNYFELSDGLIDEIVIQDDFTEDYNILKPLETNNIKVFQNPEHMYPLTGRINLLNNCKNDWVLLMDSDNFLDKNSFNALRNIDLRTDTIYCPSFSRPNFSYKEFSNNFVDYNFAVTKVQQRVPLFCVLLNTGNYLVPKKTYLEIAKQIDNCYSGYTIDVIYYNYLWLKNKNYLYILDSYEYDHTSRPDSFWCTHNSQSSSKLEDMYNSFK
jgi:hypothetical protein